MIDMLDWVAMAPKSKGLPFARETHGWENSCYDVVTTEPDGSKKWIRVKSPQGYPWDIKLVTGDGILPSMIKDWITEKDSTSWDAPPKPPGDKNYKKFVENSQDTWGRLVDGLLMFPRYVDPVALQNGITIVSPKDKTKFRIFTQCKWDNQPHDLITVTQRIFGPVNNIDFGGDVGVQPSIPHHYYWGDGTREENHYVLNYGWLSWSVSKLNTVTGLYELKQRTIHNRLTPMTIKPYVFTCF